MSIHPTVTLPRAYRAAHPEVDWDTHVVRLKHVDGVWVAVGHEPKDPAVEAILGRCCCHPNGCPNREVTA